ncbi:ComEC/Rec2 family competence protein [Mycoplasmopsis caviae]|uniref:ComEC/Rec2 family competence protein n=1 Tax=Mycoplasmopsis caviae TaxID=55603 RepID=A0A3P8KAM4_9BACT|nr:ComEC/Rec2 family competence protein [Mycoplasmopsis caviae]UUD35500.1 ComEC/Rec2 family competence protein [Mycoplasmopsis caviae]VDR41724.1 ComEC/Rec2-related protein [Mycoplasmopsis caviae]
MHLIINAYESKIFWVILFIIHILTIALIKPKFLILASIVLCLYLSYSLSKSKIYYEKGFYKIGGSISALSEKYLVISNDNNNILVYTSGLKNATPLSLGDNIEIQGELNSVEINSSKIATFYLQNNINYLLKKATILTVNKANYSIEQSIINYSKNNGQLFDSYWRLLVFGSYDSRELVLEKVNRLNIVHLIVISGLHFDLLFYLVLKILKPLDKIKLKSKYIAFALIFYYLTLLSNPISALRAYIMQVVKNSKNPFSNNGKFKKYDGLIIAILILFLIKNNYLFSMSFILSFSSTFAIMLLVPLITNKKNNAFIKTLMLASLIYLFNVPLLLYISEYWNYFGLLLGIIMAPIFQVYHIASTLFWWSPAMLNWMYYLIDNLLYYLVEYTISLKINIELNWWIIIGWCSFWYVSISFINLGKMNKNLKIKVA